MYEDGVNERAVDAVANLYRHLIDTSSLSQKNISQLTTYLISAFFVEKTRMGTNWESIASSLNTHDFDSLVNAGKPLPMLDTVDGIVTGFSEEVWALIDHCRLIEWDLVSPLVFGSAFQGILEMDTKEITDELTHGGGKRREFGAHYTSEENILRVIRPLFLDELESEIGESYSESLHTKIAKLTFLDPAVGCASFLVVIYRELRRLETAMLSHKGDIAVSDYRVSLGQLYGIEINPESAQIAHLALAIAEHQMNKEAESKLSSTVAISTEANITVGNALLLDWQSVLPSHACNYIIGNPPFRGALKMTRGQKADMKLMGKESGITTWGALDLVAAWFVKSALYINPTPVEHDDGLYDLFESSPDTKDRKVAISGESAPIATKVAFVSTNSISQGLHIPNLWSWMFERGIEIGFAYPSFKWSNEASGHASVTVVIVGFGTSGSFTQKRIYSGETARDVDFINGGLTPLRVGAVEPIRGRTLSSGIPNAELGNLPRGKSFVVSAADRQEAVARNPKLERWLPPFVGADELTKNGEQYCLWLIDAPDDILKDPFIAARVEDIKRQRLESTKRETRDAAATPELFDEIRQPERSYLAIPTSSSGNRKYIPMKFLPASTIASNALKTLTGATPFHFAVLSSSMHMAWMRNTSARLGGGNDYSYSVASTYNTFPWLDSDEWTTAALSALGSEILSVRELHKETPLGKLYTTMPDDLASAHNKLDSLLDASYGYTGDGSDDSRFEFLYALYTKSV